MYLIIILLMLGMGGNVLGQLSLNVSRIGFVDTPGISFDVEISGDYAYVADYGSGLRIINITNPAAPTETGFYDTPDFAYGVALSASYAYVADSEIGLQIINITNPVAPTLAGFYDTPGIAFCVAASGNYAYVADLPIGLRIINITNPAAPTLEGFFDTPGSARSVAVSGTYAYVAGDAFGLRIINITNPAAPIEAGYYDTPGIARGVAVSGPYAYVADGDSGLRIIDITNPAAPIEAGFYDTPGVAHGVAVSGNYAYVADDGSGLRVINITNPAAPAEAGYYYTPGRAIGVTVSGAYVYVADYSSGLGVYSFFAPGLRMLYPNGNESVSVFAVDTIHWAEGDTLIESISIELNRHYPVGAWETITDSTANDGTYEWFVTDPLSDSCRIRICALQDTFCDVSDGNFSIVSSQGYLALVRSSQANAPVTGWNFGAVECPNAASQWFRLKNFGSESIVVFQPLEPVSSEFSRNTPCGTFFALAPNQMSACSVRVVFDPASDGVYADTLRVQTDAVNGVNGFVEFALAGEQISTPAAPEVVITAQGEDARLSWAVVDSSLGGCDVTIERYLVFYAPSSNGPYYYHGWTADTTYVHAGVVSYASGMFYQVVAVDGPAAMMAGFRQGDEMSAVLGRIVSFVQSLAGKEGGLNGSETP